MRSYLLVVMLSSIIISACAAPSAPNATAIPPRAPTSIAASDTAAATPSAQTMQTPAPRQSLQRALELADGELRAIQTSANVKEARAHAEAVVNMLVGVFGRWYGDGDRDGKVSDPSDQRGVLPGERVPGPAPDVGNPVFPYGWALLAFDDGDDGDKGIVRALIGNVEEWQDSPRMAYNEIESAIASSDAQRNQVGKLNGSVPRIVAYARLMLTKAQTLDEAKAYASLAAQESSAALAAARKMNP